jgi:hypothetical protein
MNLSRSPGLKYVHRTDQAAYDYDATSLTQDSAWHTLNIAAIVPANAKLVLLRIGASHASAGRYFRVARVGDTQTFSCVNVATQVANIINEQTAPIVCTGQQIAYWATSGTFVALRLLVLGWFV